MRPVTASATGQEQPVKKPKVQGEDQIGHKLHQEFEELRQCAHARKASSAVAMSDDAASEGAASEDVVPVMPSVLAPAGAPASDGATSSDGVAAVVGAAVKPQALPVAVTTRPFAVSEMVRSP